jgi:hypothetical protein
MSSLQQAVLATSPCDAPNLLDPEPIRLYSAWPRLPDHIKVAV